MYAILPDDGQTNRAKHDSEIYRIYYILISCVFLNIEIESGYVTQRDDGTDFTYVASNTTYMSSCNFFRISQS
jgi:hypothetical protein